MSSVRKSSFFYLGFLCLPLLSNSSCAIDSGVDALSNGLYVHRESKSYVRIPPGWVITEPYRLRPTNPTSVIILNRDEPKVSASILWSPLGKKNWKDVIRADADDDLGEEYSILTLVYGKGKVSRPTTLDLGTNHVYKVMIEDGPDRDGKTAGALYLFEAGQGENRWKVKIRANFPNINREEYTKTIEDMIKQFGNLDQKPLEK